MRASPQVITSAMQLYFTGESLRNVQKFIELQGVKITHKTVWNWIKKYTGLMQSYLDKMTLNVSDTWRADELYFKVKGNNKFLYALMDDETRLWIAKQVSDTKYTADVRPMFREAKEHTQKRPKVFITDGAHNFMDAYKKELWTIKGSKTIHVRHIHLKGDMNNNKMERLNGEIRDREKTFRGLKKEDSPIITGYQIFHNYFRTHEGLNGITPAEASGVKIEGNNKWITLIQNASKNQ
jgi:transposase-like protein